MKVNRTFYREFNKELDKKLMFYFSIVSYNFNHSIIQINFTLTKDEEF